MDPFGYIFSFTERLLDLVNFFGPLIYAVLFTTVFSVTGIVLTPFLPGNSLLFISGTLAGSGSLNIWLLYPTILAAAILGNLVNYWIGFYFGAHFLKKENSRFISKKYIDKASDFYERHGGKAIIFARFFIALRTYAPFVAGVVRMPYKDFLFFNVLGALIWVTVLVFGGYFFGSMPLIRDNFEVIAVVIIVVLYGSILLKTIRNKK